MVTSESDGDGRAGATRSEGASAERVPLRQWLRSMSALGGKTVQVEVECARTRRWRDPLCVVVRGLLGQRLRELRCRTAAAVCDGCDEVAACDYAAIYREQFGARDTVQPMWLRGVPTEWELRDGDGFRASLVLLSTVTDVQGAYLDVALRDGIERAGRDDLAPLVRGLRVGPSRVVPWSLASASTYSERSMYIETLSPLQLRGGIERCRAECPSAPWLALLVRASVRRLAALWEVVSGSAPAQASWPDLRGIDVLEQRMEPWRGSRFSHRQRQRYEFEGLYGEASLAGEGVEEIAALLRAAELVGVGKATSMGFGALRVGAAR